MSWHICPSQVFSGKSIKAHVHWRSFCGKNVGNSDRQQKDYVLALATLGGMTKTEMILSVPCRPRWPRQARMVISCCNIMGIIALNFANGNTALNGVKTRLKNLARNKPWNSLAMQETMLHLWASMIQVKNSVYLCKAYRPNEATPSPPVLRSSMVCPLQDFLDMSLLPFN
jgi:hypothetical protein